MVHRMNLHPLHVALVAFCLAWAESCHVAPSHADAWTADEVAVARLTVSESSFANTDDARVITWIVAHQARRRGVSIAQYVATVHHRHTRNERRPWLAGLDASMQQPAGWPDSVSWADRGAPAWTRRLEAVRAALADDSHGCSSAPSTWGGTIDLARIHRMEAAGWVRVRCGRTANFFLARGGR